MYVTSRLISSISFSGTLPCWLLVGGLGAVISRSQCPSPNPFYDGNSLAIREARRFGTLVIAAQVGVNLIAPLDCDTCRRIVEQVLDGSESARPQARHEINDNSVWPSCSYIASWPFLA